jgi:site-specific DNA recombinase
MPEIPEAGLRLAIYARVSTEEQREGQNIDSQIAELERFSRDKGWPIVGIYKDEGWSGGAMERPELDRLRDDAQKGLFEAALINDVDRLARDVAHLGIIKRDLERKGVKVIFRKLPSDASATSNLMVNILGSFAEFERELILDRTRRGRRHKVEVRKEYLGSNTAYGYRYIPKDRLAGTGGILELNSQEASVIRRMFEWVDQDGLSARKVLNRLNDLGIPPKNGAPRWGKSSVLRILKNEMYAGTWHYNKVQGCEPKNPSTSARYRKRAKSSVRTRPQSEWLPLVLPAALSIIPRDRWQRVQQQLARNITFSPRNEKHTYLLKSLVRCGGCGARYVGDPCHGKFYYRCIARCKKIPTVREALLNETVKRAVAEIMLTPEVILESLRLLDAGETRDKQQKEETTVDIQQEEQRLAAEEERILEAYRTSIITPLQLGQQLEKLKARRSVIEAQRVEIQSEKMEPGEHNEEAITDYCDEASKNLENFSDQQWQEFLRTIVHTVIFYGTRITMEGRVPMAESRAQVPIHIERPLT